MSLDDLAKRPSNEISTIQDEQSFSKANEAIAIRPRRGKLTLLSRRIYNALLYHAQQQGVDKPIYRLPLLTLIGDARFNSNNTELLKAHLRDMQATTVEWSCSSNAERRWVSTQLLGTVTIEELGRGNPVYLTWKYPDEIRERIVKPNVYTKVLLEVSSLMRTYAAAVLYELGMKYLTHSRKVTMREPVIWWASVLQGKSDIEEVEYRFFHSKVLKKAIAEVNSLSPDFDLELIEYKVGRKVAELQFRVIKKNSQALDDMSGCEPKHSFDLSLIERLCALGFKQLEAQDLLSVTNESQLKAALEHTENRKVDPDMPILKSPSAYLRHALKKGYVAEAPEKAVRQPKKEPELSYEGKLTKIKDSWISQRSVVAKKHFNDLGTAEQDRYKSRFEIEVLPGLHTSIAKFWHRDGPSNRMIGATFFKWLADVTDPQELTDAALVQFAVRTGKLVVQ